MPSYGVQTQLMDGPKTKLPNRGIVGGNKRRNLEKAQCEIKVVHCAECKHLPEFKSFTDEYGHTFTNYISPDGLCPLVCDDDWYSVVRDDDWFCGDGEPMEEQNEQKEE